MLFLGEFHFVSDLCGKAEWGQFFQWGQFFLAGSQVTEIFQVLCTYSTRTKEKGEERREKYSHSKNSKK